MALESQRFETKHVGASKRTFRARLPQISHFTASTGKPVVLVPSCSGKRRSSRKDKSRSRQRKRRKKGTGPADSGSRSSTTEREQLFQAKKQRRSESSTTGDRGPFGESPAVDYKDEDGSSSEASDFRSRSTKSSQLKLLSSSRKLPGRLASRMLLKISQATARASRGRPRDHEPSPHNLADDLGPVPGPSSSRPGGEERTC